MLVNYNDDFYFSNYGGILYIDYIEMDMVYFIDTIDLSIGKDIISVNELEEEYKLPPLFKLLNKHYIDILIKEINLK